MEVGIHSVDINEKNDRTWEFWPHYILSNSTESPKLIEQSIVFKYMIFYDAFDNWPLWWRIGEEAQSNPTWLWDQVEWADGDAHPYCAWCAGIDSDSNEYDPNPPSLDKYHDDQSTFMYIEKNLRYIGLHLRYDLWLQFANDDFNDILVLKSWDGNNIFSIITYDARDNTVNINQIGPAQDGWRGFEADVPNTAFEAGDNMRIYFYFYSDVDNNVKHGAFIDDFNIITERP
ncbi:MAG: hypothetical protein QXH42_02565 [Thermoplasmata archaeon]